MLEPLRDEPPAPNASTVRTPLHRNAIAAAVAASALGGGGAAAQVASPPLWEIGALGLGVSQQAYPGSSQRIDRALALPFLFYRGPIFRADRGGAGIVAIRTSRVEVDIGVAAALGSSSGDIDARQGMPDLGTLVEIGPRLKWHIGQGASGARWRAEFPLRGVFDLDDRLGHKGMAFEPTLLIERDSLRRWRYHASVGALFADHRLADTFYGVAPPYATGQRPAYEARGGLVAWRAPARRFPTARHRTGGPSSSPGSMRCRTPPTATARSSNDREA